MKKIAVFFETPDPMDYPLSKPDYWAAYSELSQEIKDQGNEMLVVRGQGSYLGEGVFSNSWKIEHNELRQTGRIKVDVVYNKGRFLSDNKVKTFNTQEIVDICLDKWSMYTLLTEFCPKTFFVQDEQQLKNSLSAITTDKAVFKPYKGSEGIGVKIEDKSFFVDPPETLSFPAVLSEFLDTSVGVPGIVDGLHDLRVAIFDGEVLYSYYRTPPQGSFLANVAQGGKFEMIEPKRLPHEVVAISKLIDSRFTVSKHRFYSVDFGYTAQGPKIIEMNSEVGLLPNKDHPIFRTLKQKLAQAFVEM
jgi:glutathione synthase/RimK-type ligase-like ATP-grasp enzyme